MIRIAICLVSLCTLMTLQPVYAQTHICPTVAQLPASSAMSDGVLRDREQLRAAFREDMTNYATYRNGCPSLAQAYRNRADGLKEILRGVALDTLES
ncbi:hypothetical protein [Pontivivens insulae]|uniref:TIGR02301 family protein n=1 Tax=Pontivivens insulae TaxID=1639689 RepID=A0A2R8A7C6_9RHOB|nr:hypothetical protein [Pontivivens insulae]RED18024.1 hypothetical protein DFR53_0215 [Pontivivens insulae]SPF27920.1 hypothetical protein POI8812_00215 [Pontivivens insulae]